ncbi:prolactin-releasing peptide receptor-like [Glandiceps talaboti]
MTFRQKTLFTSKEGRVTSMSRSMIKVSEELELYIKIVKLYREFIPIETIIATCPKYAIVHIGLVDDEEMAVIDRVLPQLFKFDNDIKLQESTSALEVQDSLRFTLMEGQSPHLPYVQLRDLSRIQSKMNGSTDGFVFDYFESVYKDSSSHPAFRWIFILIYTGIIILSVVGNIMVCIAVKRNGSLHTPTYVFICNLSVSDVAVSVFCLPLTLAYTLTNTWNFGEFLCYTVAPLQAVSVLVSTLTMAAIAIDRYVLIMYPLRKRITLQKSVLIIVLIWMVSLVLSIPLIMYRLYEKEIYPELYLNSILCSESWPNAQSKQAYTLTIFVVQYAFPISLIFVSYGRVWTKLKNRVVPGVLTPQQLQSEMCRKQKTNKMLMAVVAVFAVCWLPLNIWIILSEFRFSIIDDKWIDLSFHLCHSFAMSTTCINPFLYGRLSDAFRKEFRQMAPRVLRPPSRTASSRDRQAQNNQECNGISMNTLQRVDSDLAFQQSQRSCAYVDNSAITINSISTPSSNPTQHSLNLI